MTSRLNGALRKEDRAERAQRFFESISRGIPHEQFIFSNQGSKLRVMEDTPRSPMMCSSGGMSLWGRSNEVDHTRVPQGSALCDLVPLSGAM